MIEDIEINNFRCFDRLKVSGCKRLNLISGKNNVGKTALLESILLNSKPIVDTIVSISDLRRESIHFRRELLGKYGVTYFASKTLKQFARLRLFSMIDHPK
jgi:AAA15 family ATPase/GTPase